MHRFDRADHRLAGIVLGNPGRLEAQRGERGAQVMAERAEHDVLFTYHCRQSLLHRVEAGDQGADVARPLDRKRGMRGRAEQAVRGFGKPPQRLARTAQQEQREQQQHDVKRRGLKQQFGDQRAERGGAGGKHAQPLAIVEFNREADHARFEQSGVSVDGANFARPDLLLGELLRHARFGGAETGCIGGDRRLGADLGHSRRRLRHGRDALRSAGDSAGEALRGGDDGGVEA